MEIDELYMRRALELAGHGEGFTMPNPMVGAVIVARGRVIGEGYHRRCGGPHAEVWAVRSVKDCDKALLAEATVYVTLEPCSHYGKTPPCADMLAAAGVKRVVVGCLDPNPKVAGRGIGILRRAGIQVTVDVLRDECFELNRRFMVTQIRKRPYVLLKWACSADGYLDRVRPDSEPAEAFSTAASLQSMHRLRACHEAIMVGAGTVIYDDPSLTLRFYSGLSPRPVIVDRRGMVPAKARLFANPRTVYITSRLRKDIPADMTQIEVPEDAQPELILQELKRLGICSVMVEGGAALLRSFMECGTWDDARVETTRRILGPSGRARLSLPDGILGPTQILEGGNVIINVKNRDSLI